MFVFDSGFIWAVYVPVAWFISRHTNLGIVPFYAIIEGLEILKSSLGTIMIRKRIWVRNLVQQPQ
jgi:Na+-driven multidrug efflux pump